MLTRSRVRSTISDSTVARSAALVADSSPLSAVREASAPFAEGVPAAVLWPVNA